MQNDLFEIPMTSSVHMSSRQISENPAFLDRYRLNLRLDQAVAGTIVLIMVYVLVFSFGVEKGKRFAMEELKSERTKREHMVNELRQKLIENRIVPKAENPVRPFGKTIGPTANPAPFPHHLESGVKAEELTQPMQPAAAIVPVSMTPAKLSPAVQKGKYTIQMVAYKNKVVANRAVEDLAKKGILAFLLQTGSHWELYAGNYESHEQAKQALKDLKGRGIIPPDAYVRSMPQ